MLALLAMLLMAQPQPSAAQAAQDEAGVPAQSAASLSPQDKAALEDVRKLLQELMQAMQPGQAQTDAGPMALEAARESDAAFTVPGDAAGGEVNAQDNAVPPEMLARLVALLNQAALQLSADVSGASSQGTAIQTDAAQAGKAHSGDDSRAALAEALADIASLVTAKTGASGAAAHADADGGASSLSGAFAVSEQTAPRPPAGDLQSALDRLVSVLANAHGGKADVPLAQDGLAQEGKNTSGGGLSGGDAPPASAFAAAHAAPASAPDTAFVKLLASSASNAPVADQVLVRIKSAAADGESQIRIQLAPEDLGKVVVQLTTGADGKTGISITADNRQTLLMLQQEARALESALRDIGIKTDTGGLSFNLSGQQPDTRTPSRQAAYTQAVAVTASDEDAEYYGAAVNLYRMTAQQGLDIRV